jgi:hypothetical protein
MDDACSKSCHEHQALQWPTTGAVRENPSHSMPHVCHRTVAVVLIAGVSQDGSMYYRDTRPTVPTHVNFDACHHHRRMLVRRRPSSPVDALRWLGDD